MDLAPFLPVIILTSLGFLLLAFLLLGPVYLFLNREEKISQQWTEEALAQRLRAGKGPGTSPQSPNPPA